MKEKLAASTALMALSLSACNGSSPEHSSPSAESIAQQDSEVCVEKYFEDPESLEIGRQIANRALRSAAHLEERLNNREATEVSDFLHAHTTVTGVSEDKTEVIGLSEKLAYDCEFTDQIAQAHAFGHFNHDADAIFIIDKEQPLSELWGGVLMLHETRHAKGFEAGTQTETEERDTRVFEQEIVAEIGGKPYTSLLKRIETQIENAGFNEQEGFLLQTIEMDAFHDELDKIFGKSISQADVRQRDTVVYIHATFNIAAKIAPIVGEDVAIVQQRVINALESMTGVNGSPK